MARPGGVVRSVTGAVAAAGKEAVERSGTGEAGFCRLLAGRVEERRQRER